MKSKKIRLISLLVLAISFVACTNDGTVMHKNITGAAGEMVVVISKNSWEGTPGKLIRETLAQPQLGLPQDEPILILSMFRKLHLKIFFEVPEILFKQLFPGV